MSTSHCFKLPIKTGIKVTNTKEKLVASLTILITQRSGKFYILKHTQHANIRKNAAVAASSKYPGGHLKKRKENVK